MVGQEIFIMNLVFELLLLEGNHNHIFGENLRRMAHCYLFEAKQVRGRIFSCSPAHTEIGQKRGTCKWLIF
jgi:hypothetical protein